MPKLVLNRLPQQQVFIAHPDGKITVTVLDVQGANVRLLFDAPRSVDIERDDVKSRPPAPPSSYPCTKCGQPSWTLDSLCFKCQQIENGD